MLLMFQFVELKKNGHNFAYILNYVCGNTVELTKALVAWVIEYIVYIYSLVFWNKHLIINLVNYMFLLKNKE